MSMRITRRAFVAGTVVATTAGCQIVEGILDEVPTDAPTTGDTSEPTTTQPTTRPSTPWVGVDGNVLRDYAVVDGVLVPIAWRNPRGDTRLSVEELTLVLRSPRHGVLALDGIRRREAKRLVVQNFGESTLNEARRALEVLSAAS